MKKLSIKKSKNNETKKQNSLNFNNMFYKIIPLLMASVFYFSICRYQHIPPYGMVSWLIYGAIILLFYKTDLKNLKDKKKIIIMSLIFTILAVYGDIVYNLMYEKNINILDKILTVKTLISLIGTFNIIFIILANIFPKLIKAQLSKASNIIKSKKVIFILSFVVILLAWLPYFLSMYPAAMSGDSFGELTMVINNFETITDHHPVLHLIFLWIPYTLGYKIFGTITAGVACTTITQMISMALIFSSFITFLYNRKVNEKILLIVLCYFAFIPMHGYYSVVMWKDVIFSGTMLILSMETYKLFEKEKNNNLDIKHISPFIIASLLCVFFRNNAIYMYVIFSIFLILVFKKHYKLFLTAITIVFGTYIVVKGPVFNYLNIVKSASTEYIGMPLQQVGRMAYKDIEFTAKEKKIIDELIPLSIMKEAYNPIVSDGIKFNKNYNIKVFDENKFDYLKLWLGLVVKHPITAIEAYSVSALGYWYPGVEFWTVEKTIMEGNNFDLKMEPKAPSFVRTFVNKIESRNLPIMNITWSIGLCFWIIGLFAYITMLIKGKRYILYYIPVIGLWITMLVASPVFCEFRYVYGAFTCLPFLLLVPYIDKNKSKKTNK